MSEARPKRIFRGFAVCFWLLAISNFSKPFQLTEQSGFVLLGTRLSGSDNLTWSLVFGAYLVVYGLGLWHRKRFAVGMSHAYALYVVLNLFLYWSHQPPAGGVDALFAGIYSLVAVGTSVSAAVLLSLRRKELG